VRLNVPIFHWPSTRRQAIEMAPTGVVLIPFAVRP